MMKWQGRKIDVMITEAPAVVEASDGQVSISIPMELRRQSGRHLISLPDGYSVESRPWDTTSTPIQRALARGMRWLKWLEEGRYHSLSQIAAKEGCDNSYVSRMVNLASLAPDIVEAILDNTLPSHVTLFELAVDPPRLWEDQRKTLLKDGVVAS